ncbi:uncharacterized protein PSFLO_01148 [Pseudozyma flocculosa]|nr:uncharacterized protein PSFLO_01148 [Pseudozyma flocculosa]
MPPALPAHGNSVAPGTASFSPSSPSPSPSLSPSASPVSSFVSAGPTPRRNPSDTLRSSGMSSTTTAAAASADTTRTASPARTSVTPASSHAPSASPSASSPGSACASTNGTRSNVKLAHDAAAVRPPSSHPSPSRPNRAILGPDGQYYTPGEAAKLGLTIRTACEACRTRKLRCSGTPPEQGGCQRCSSDAIPCIYTARAPIGRPKKRKVEQGDEDADKPASAEVRQARPSSKLSSVKSSTDPSSRVGKARPQKKQAKAVQHSARERQPAALHEIKGEASASLRHGSMPDSVPSDFAQLLSAAAAVHGQADAAEDSQHSSASQAPRPGLLPPERHHLSHAPSYLPSHPTPSHAGNAPSHSPSTGPVETALSHADYLGNSPFRPATASFAQPSSMSPHDPSVPSLDDLSIAAFLQSLDTLEIEPSELLNRHVGAAGNSVDRSRSTLKAPDSGGGMVMGSAGSSWANGHQPSFPTSTRQSAFTSSREQTADHTLALPPSATATPGVDAISAEDLEAQFNEWSSSSAILQDGLSFAVPADFSWWDLGPSLDPDLSSTAATPANELAQAGPWGPVSRPPSRYLVKDPPSHRRNDPAARHGQDWSNRAAHAGLQLSTRWPRGAENGMGQGQIQTTGNASATGLSWASIPLSPVGPSTAQPAASGPATSDCGSPSARSSTAAAVEAQQSAGPSVDAGTVKPCCSSKKAAADGSGPMAAHQETAVSQDSVLDPSDSCCSKDRSSVASTTTPTTGRPVPSCCSKKKDATPDHVTSASTTKAPGTQSDAGAHAADGKPLSSSSSSSPKSQPSKVHCVPNPSGKGCTCLCDMSVALLSVKRTLRETASPHVAASGGSSQVKQEDDGDSGEAGSSTDSAPRRRAAAARAASTTIQLTLSASQAIAAQCACSADCPTCRSDPSTEISASLLVSTALQIYARAVRTLREGFAAGGAFAVVGGSGAAGPGGLDVRIGEYKPAPANARRIALFAMKLELKDLSAALGKISRMAQKTRQRTDPSARGEEEARSQGGEGAPKSNDGASGGATTTTATATATAPDASWMNPIDQLVILKLHQQLGELLATVENLEAQSSVQPASGHSHHHHDQDHHQQSHVQPRSVLMQ